MTESTSLSMPKLMPEENFRPERKIGCLTYCCVIGFVVIVLVWFNIFRNGPPLRISPETTYITEPLTPDSRYVDYFAALEQRIYPPEMQTDDNGYRVVLRVLGDFANETRDTELLRQRYEKLGLDYTLDKPTLTYIEPEEFFKKRYISHPEEFEDIIAAENERYAIEKNEELQQEIADIEAVSNFTTAEKEEIIAWFWESNQYSFDPIDYWRSLHESSEFHKNPIVQKWLVENNAAIDLLAEQVQKPIFVMPYIGGDGAFRLIAAPCYNGLSMSVLARGLETRAKIRIGSGDIGGAIDDIMACYHFGRHIEKQASRIEGLIGIAIENIAHSMAFDGHSEFRVNAEQLKRLQDGLATLPPQQGFWHILEYGRLACLDSMMDVFKGAIADSGSEGGIMTRVGIFGMDWNLGFKKINKVFDEMDAGTFTSTRPSMSLVRWLTLKSRSEAMADIFINMLALPVEATKDAYHRVECAMNMKRIVLAMHLYEREHGTLPPTFSVDADGKPLHSWRTLLLPYLGDTELAELYAQIRLNEPWNSEHNRQFHKRSIDVYRCPSNKSMLNGGTSYAVIVGDGLLFTNDGIGQTITERGRNMLMIVERSNATVCWMQPDAEISQANAELGISHSSSTQISNNHTGGANIGLRDGSVAFISEMEPPAFFGELVRGTAKEKP